MKKKFLFIALVLAAPSAWAADCETVYISYYRSLGANAVDFTSDVFSLGGLGLTTVGAPGAGSLATSAASSTGSGRADAYKRAQVLGEAKLGDGVELRNYLDDIKSSLSSSSGLNVDYDVDSMAQAISDANNSGELCPNNAPLSASDFDERVTSIMLQHSKSRQ